MPYAVISTTSASGATSFTPLEQLGAAHARHHQVRQDDLRGKRARLVQGLRTVARRDDLMALLLQDLHQALGVTPSSSTTSTRVLLAELAVTMVPPVLRGNIETMERAPITTRARAVAPWRLGQALACATIYQTCPAPTCCALPSWGMGSPPTAHNTAPRPPSAAKKKTAATTAASKSGKPRKAVKKGPTRRAPQAARGPEAAHSALALETPGTKDLVAMVVSQGGAPLGAYQDPFAGRPLLLASIPLKRVAETPFQRDLSKTHADRLVAAIGATGVFLDPHHCHSRARFFVAQRPPPSAAAAHALGMRSITALLTPDRALAYRILALDAEKAHNLKDRALEVIRMARALAVETPKATESDHALAFESAPLLTLGATYERAGRFAGSVYQPLLRRVDVWQAGGLPAALRQRDQYAQKLLDIDARVTDHVKALQAKGMQSPYLKTLVVARCNPLRFVPPNARRTRRRP